MTEKNVQRITHQSEIANINFDEVEIRRQIEERLSKGPVPLPSDPVILRDLRKRVEKVVSSFRTLGLKLNSLSLTEFDRSYRQLHEHLVQCLLPRISRHLNRSERAELTHAIKPLIHAVDALKSGETDMITLKRFFAESYVGFSVSHEMLLDRIEATLDLMAESKKYWKLRHVDLLERINDSLMSPSLSDDVYRPISEFENQRPRRQLDRLIEKHRIPTRKPSANRLEVHVARMQIAINEDNRSIAKAGEDLRDDVSLGIARRKDKKKPR